VSNLDEKDLRLTVEHVLKGRGGMSEPNELPTSVRGGDF
jgi:hypothetical protein